MKRPGWRLVFLGPQSEALCTRARAMRRLCWPSYAQDWQLSRLQEFEVHLVAALLEEETSIEVEPVIWPSFRKAVPTLLAGHRCGLAGSKARSLGHLNELKNSQSVHPAGIWQLMAPDVGEILHSG